MFLGHYAVALAAKKAAPQTSLGTLFFATQFIDLLWPFLLIAGVENVRIAPGDTAFTPLDFYNYPYSHSLAFVLLWSVVLGGAYFGLKRSAKGALVVGALVASHWFADLLAHRPDLPVLPSGPMVGLGLWNSVPATLLVESAMFGGGLWIYLRELAREGRKPTKALWILIGFLVVIYVANSFGPPPPNVEAIAFSGLALWLVAPWAAWAERRTASLAK